MTVTYRLTALSEAGKEYLDRFTAGYPDFLRGWQDAINTATRAQGTSGSA